MGEGEEKIREREGRGQGVGMVKRNERKNMEGSTGPMWVLSSSHQ